MSGLVQVLKEWMGVMIDVRNGEPLPDVERRLRNIAWNYSDGPVTPEVEREIGETIERLTTSTSSNLPRVTLPVVESGVDVECSGCGNEFRLADIPDVLLCDDCRGPDYPTF